MNLFLNSLLGSIELFIPALSPHSINTDSRDILICLKTTSVIIHFLKLFVSIRTLDSVSQCSEKKNPAGILIAIAVNL